MKPLINLKWKCDICGKQGAREYFGQGVACEICAFEYEKRWYSIYRKQEAN
jgi:hypothetical protein